MKKWDDQGGPKAPSGIGLHRTAVPSTTQRGAPESVGQAPPTARRTPTGVLLVAVEGNPAAVPDSPADHSERVYRHGVRQRARRRLLEYPSGDPFRWRRARVAISPFASLYAAQEAEHRHLRGEKLDPGRLNALKGMGRLPRSDGSYRLSPKYQIDE